jgi:hypothetical protein
MTLIAAWITPEFRIMASDSKSSYKDGHVVFDCKKVFISNELAVGVYGILSETNLNIIEKHLNENPEEQKEQFVLDLYKLFPDLTNGEQRLDIFDSPACHLLVIPRDDIPELFCFSRNFKPIRMSVEEYKSHINSSLPSEIYFSEQILNNEEIDKEHQKELLSYFNTLVNEQAIQRVDIDLQERTEVKLIAKLLKDVIIKKNQQIARDNIGGTKIYYAFSFNCHIWQNGNYELEKQGEEPLDELLTMNFMSKLINDKMNLNG